MMQYDCIEFRGEESESQSSWNIFGPLVHFILSECARRRTIKAFTLQNEVTMIHEC